MISQAQDAGAGRGRCMIDTVERTEAGFEVMLSRVSVSLFFPRTSIETIFRGKRVEGE